MTDPPIVTGDELVAWLKGAPDADVAALCAGAASDAVAAVVDPPPDPLPEDWAWADGVRLAGLGVAGDAYKSLSAPGGGYVLDEVTFTDVFRLTSTIVRRYEPFYAASRAIGGMVG